MVRTRMEALRQLKPKMEAALARAATDMSVPEAMREEAKMRLQRLAAFSTKS